MYGTADLTIAPETARPATSGLGDIRARVAGIGALGFAGIVVLQNLIRGGSAPSNGASSDDVLAHYADHRALTVLLVSTFMIGGTALTVFLGGAMRRLTAVRPGWAYTGYAGAVGVLALFATMLGTEVSLSVVAAGDAPSTSAIQALWALHNSLFTMLFLFIGVALVGLSRAGVAAGITPRAFERVAPVSFALLTVAAVAGPLTAAGDAMVFFGVGLAGFLVWLAFLITTGLRLVRSESGIDV